MTGTLLRQVGGGSAHKCAYTAVVQWTPEAIRREREARGWSQRKLAEELRKSAPEFKVGLRSVTAWENGESMPSGRNLAALDRVLGDTDGDADDPATAIAPGQPLAGALIQLGEALVQVGEALLQTQQNRTPARGQHATLPEHLIDPQADNRRRSDG